jgi:hypothetical protein
MRLKPLIIGAALLGGAVAVTVAVRAARAADIHEVETGFGKVPVQPTPSEVRDYGLDSGGAEELR